eukprot:6484643-Amphidinium_carterae.1
MGSKNGDELSVLPPALGAGGGARRGRKPGSKTTGGKEKGAPENPQNQKSKKLRACRLCKGYVDLEKTPKGVYCDADTRALGRLRALSKQKGEEKWFSETIKDTDRLQHLVDNYWEACGGRRRWESKTPAIKFNITEYCESIRTSTGFDCKRRRKMMWRKEYIAHLQKAKGGAYTFEQANAKWDALVAAKDAGDKTVKWDLEGPREDCTRCETLIE